MTSLTEKRIMNILLTEALISIGPKIWNQRKNNIREKPKINNSDQGQNTGIRQ
jgi:hypothetical protein